jgi:Transposase DDE domain
LGWGVIPASAHPPPQPSPILFGTESALRSLAFVVNSPQFPGRRGRFRPRDGLWQRADAYDAGMAARPRATVKERDLQGFKYFQILQPFLDRLHSDATQRDRAGNRRLHFDQYGALILLYFFNPILTSLRGIQQASELGKVQKLLGCSRASFGSLSEASRVFDPPLLRDVLGELADQAVPLLHGKEAEALRGLTAVDGSILPALPRMAWALWTDDRHRAAKLHLHFDVLKGVPCDAAVTAAASSEPDQLRAALQADRLYVIDRGYAGYQLFRDILDAGSSFIGRVKDNTAFTVNEERPVTADAAAAGVVRDVVVAKLGASHHKDYLQRPVRLIVVHRTKPDGSPEELWLLTDRLDLPADLAALAYRYRWTVELFFRWFKCILGCRHLLSSSRNGVEIQVYLALIASLLITLWTGKKPTKRTWEMVQFYFVGLASEAELIAHIERLQAA